jgi:hypothetical protein
MNAERAPEITSSNLTNSYPPILGTAVCETQVPCPFLSETYQNAIRANHDFQVTEHFTKYYLNFKPF